MKIKNCISALGTSEKHMIVYGLKFYLKSYWVIELVQTLFLCKNMHRKSKISVRLSRGKREFFPSNVGLKQGYNTNPLLFNLFISHSNKIFDECFCHSATRANVKLNNLSPEDGLILISET